MQECVQHLWVFSSYDEHGTRYRCKLCGELKEEENWFMQGKWPDKMEHQEIDQYASGFNAAHDEFMKVINEQPELVSLDEELLYIEITNKSRPPYMQWERVLARRICEKYGQSKPNVPSVEQIITLMERMGRSDNISQP